MGDGDYNTITCKAIAPSVAEPFDLAPTSGTDFETFDTETD